MPMAAKLKRLDLQDSDIGDAGGRVLAKFPALEELRLNGCDVGEDNFEALGKRKLELHADRYEASGEQIGRSRTRRSSRLSGDRASADMR